jgi:hypothetical protein
MCVKPNATFNYLLLFSVCLTKVRPFWYSTHVRYPPWPVRAALGWPFGCSITIMCAIPWPALLHLPRSLLFFAHTRRAPQSVLTPKAPSLHMRTRHKNLAAAEKR